jgi:outer membrane protein assembly factor BamB
VFDVSQGPEAAAKLLSDPSADPADLAAIAGAFPALAPEVAAHPRLYPDLEGWLRALGRADVDAALANRPPVGTEPTAPAADAAPPASEPAAPAAQPAPPVEAAPPAETPPTAAMPPAEAPPTAMPPAGAPPAGPAPGGAAPIGMAPGAASAPPSGAGPAYGGMPPAAQAPGTGGQAQTGPTPTLPGGMPPMGPPNQTAPYPQLPKPKSSKTKLIAIIAAAVVVVLVLVLVLVMFVFKKGSKAGAMVRPPDLMEKPVVGDKVSSDDILGDEFSEVYVSVLPGSKTALFTGNTETDTYSNWYPGYDADYDEGKADAEAYDQAQDEYDECWDGPNWRDCEYPSQYDFRNYQDTSEPPGYADGWYGYDRETKPDVPEVFAAVAAADVPSGERKWLVDVGKELELDLLEGSINVSTTNNREGKILVEATQNMADSSEDETSLITLDLNGKILSKKADIGGYVHSFHQNVVITIDEDTITAYQADDLEKTVWEKDKAEFGVHSIGNIYSGICWILTEDGYVDCVTGQDKPFGKDAADSDSDYTYRLTGGNEHILLRVDLDDESMMRINPDNGEDMWDKDVDAEGATMTNTISLVNGKLLWANSDGKLTAFNPSDGEELWSQKKAYYRGFTASALIITEWEDEISLRNLDDGKETMSEDMDGGHYVGSGSKVLYIEAGDDLVALDMGDDLDELWTLKLSKEFKGAWSISVVYNETGFFAIGESDGEASIREIKPE